MAVNQALSPQRGALGLGGYSVVSTRPAWRPPPPTAEAVSGWSCCFLCFPGPSLRGWKLPAARASGESPPPATFHRCRLMFQPPGPISPLPCAGRLRHDMQAPWKLWVSLLRPGAGEGPQRGEPSPGPSRKAVLEPVASWAPRPQRASGAFIHSPQEMESTQTQTGERLTNLWCATSTPQPGWLSTERNRLLQHTCWRHLQGIPEGAHCTFPRCRCRWNETVMGVEDRLVANGREVGVLPRAPEDPMVMGTFCGFPVGGRRSLRLCGHCAALDRHTSARKGDSGWDRGITSKSLTWL